MAYIVQVILRLRSGNQLIGYIKTLDGDIRVELFEKQEQATRFKTREEAEEISTRIRLDIGGELPNKSVLEFKIMTVRARRIY